MSRESHVFFSLHTYVQSRLELASCLENYIHVNLIHYGNRSKTTFKLTKQPDQGKVVYNLCIINKGIKNKLCFYSTPLPFSVNAI